MKKMRRRYRSVHNPAGTTMVPIGFTHFLPGRKALRHAAKIPFYDRFSIIASPNAVTAWSVWLFNVE
jgi:hypothetical protein